MSPADGRTPRMSNMTIGEPVIFDDRVILKLRAGTRFVEISSGREFTVGARPGQLWHGTTPCGIECLDLPVQVIGA